MNNTSFLEEDFDDGSGFDSSDHCAESEFTLTDQIVRSTLYCAAMLVSLLANSLLICVVRRNRRMRTVTHHLIVNMAVADLLITVFHMPYMLQVYVTGSHQLHVSGILATLTCKVAGFSQDLSIACSVLSLVAIAFDRFFAILFPLKKVLSQTRASSIIATVWLVSLMVCAPLLYANRMEEDDEGAYCYEDWSPGFDNDTASRDFTVVLFVILYACPLVLISVLYSSIVYRVWRRQIPGAHTGRRSHATQKARRKLLKLLIVVVGVFTLCWLPYYVQFFMEYFSNKYVDCSISDRLQFAGRFLGHINSAVNPCMYFILNKEYRNGVKQVCRCLCCIKGRAVRADTFPPSTLSRSYDRSFVLLRCKAGAMTASSIDSVSQNVKLTRLSISFLQ